MRFGKNAIIVLSIGGGMFLWTAAARTQSTRSAVEVPPAFHREQPDDPPGKAAKDNPHARSPAARAQRGPFVSIQVNVDEFGNNIVGDAANEPSIAIDPNNPDRIVIGWRQFDTVNSNFRQAGWAYSHDGGQTWTFSGVHTPGVFRSDPVLDSDSDGNIYYYSLKGNFLCDMFKSLDGGVTWLEPVPAFGGDKPWMGIDKTEGIGQGNIYCSWGGVFIRSTDGGASFVEPVVVPLNPFWGTIAIGPEGEVYVGGVGNPFTVAKSTNAQDPNEIPVFDFATSVELGGPLVFGGGPNPGGLLGQAWVATDQSGGPSQGNVYMLASVRPPGPDPLDVHFVRSTDGGLNWSDPVRVNDDPEDNQAWQWFGTMSVAPNGRIDVIWNDTRSSGNARLSELFYSFSTDEGVTWATNIPVSPMFDSHVGWPHQNKIGDYYDMISDNAAANLAYAATFNGEQDVYFLRLIVDCNGNGTPDECDIDCGPPNGPCDLPDCGQSEDCNGNGTPDECDIANGTSSDNDGDGIPDECVLALALDIKPGACPNPFNRHGNGVLPVALVGTGEFDPAEVDLSTLQLSRADGVGGNAGPNEGPPGPHSVFEDVATPFGGEACECHDLGGDGIDDLSMKFRTDEMVEALELDALPGGAVVELVLSGSLLDGTPFVASDCIVIVPPGDTSPANAQVQSNVADTFVEVAPPDLNLDDDGFADFSRSYYSGTAMTFTAPPHSAGRRFVRWVVDGAPQPIGIRTIEVIVSEDTTLKVAYARPTRATPTHPTESDDPLE